MQMSDVVRMADLANETNSWIRAPSTTSVICSKTLVQDSGHLYFCPCIRLVCPSSVLLHSWSILPLEWTLSTGPSSRVTVPVSTSAGFFFAVRTGNFLRRKKEFFPLELVRFFFLLSWWGSLWAGELLLLLLLLRLLLRDLENELIWGPRGEQQAGDFQELCGGEGERLRFGDSYQPTALGAPRGWYQWCACEKPLSVSRPIHALTHEGRLYLLRSSLHSW